MRIVGFELGLTTYYIQSHTEFLVSFERRSITTQLGRRGEGGGNGVRVSNMKTGAELLIIANGRMGGWSWCS